ncbi:MAG: GNAT family N-acetyltransferase [bacterium]|nr:GNAT family N-acetyltransferase [bacterium]
MKLVLYDQADSFEQLKPEWNDLLQRSAVDTVFGTWEWLSTWWAVYEPGQLWMVACRDEDGRLLGLAPWSIVETGEGRMLAGIGCIDVTDYIDVLVDADCTGAVLNCLALFVNDHRDQFDLISLCNIPEKSPTLSQFQQSLQHYGFNTNQAPIEVCPVIQLPENWETYLEGLDKKQRHELRRKLRRTQAEEELNWYIVGQEHNLEEELDHFLRLMAASDPKKARFLQDENNVAFFRRVMPLMFENGWLQLIFLTIDGERVAAYLNFDYKGHIMVYNSGLARDTHEQLSAGIVLLANNIRYAIEHGYKVFDFLRGNETYKYYLGGKDTTVYMLNAVKG